MGIQPTKEKIFELIKECSKINYSKNNINKTEYQNDQEMDLYIEDDDYLYNKYHSQDNSTIFLDVKNCFSFPYISFGTIHFKLKNESVIEQICFLIYKKIIATYFPFSEDENIVEIKSSFSDEILSLNSCKKYTQKNLAIFYLKEKKFSKWIGVEQNKSYLEECKNKSKKKNVKIIFIREQKDNDKIETDIISNDNRIDNFIENDNIHILTEFFCNYDDLDKLKDNKILQNEKRIIGGIIYYKNDKGGAYVLGIIDKNINPILFDRETLTFLYKIIYGESRYSVTGIDENVIELDLSKKDIGPSHIKILTEFNLINLKKLNLLKNQIGPQGAFYLGQSKLSNLEILILNFNSIGDEGMEYISKGPFLNLKYLYLYHNNLTNKGVNLILESIFVDTLIFLDLSDNPYINNEGIIFIKEKIKKNSNVLKNLKNLCLSFTSINDKAVDIINNINFPKLKKLVLKGIKFSNFGNVSNTLKNKKIEVVFDNNDLIVE